MGRSTSDPSANGPTHGHQPAPSRSVLTVVLTIVAVSAMVGASGVSALGKEVSPTGVSLLVREPATARELPTAVPRFTVYSQTFPAGSTVYDVASNKSTALLDVYLQNTSNELVLFDATTNTSKVVQPIVPGYGDSLIDSLVAAGGSFFGSWQNFSSQKEFFEKITLGGKVTKIHLPLASSQVWSFPYGNASSLYATDGPLLIQLDPHTLKLVANLTTYVPSKVTLDSVLPVGQRIYLAGAYTSATGGTSPYFGYANLSSGTTTNVTHALKHVPNGLTGLLLSIALLGSNIYVGGSLDSFSTGPFDLRVVGGYLDRFDPATASYKNLSAMLPVKGWGVWALVPWLKTIALSLTGFNITPTTVQYGGGIYTLSAGGKSLANETSLLPAAYAADADEETAVSGGWFFSGGENFASSSGQAVAIRI
jgi:hypothetical protein